MSATSMSRRSGGQPRRAKAPTATREAELQRQLTVQRNNLDLLEARLRESVANVSLSESGVADLESQLINDPGWRLFSVLQAQEFSPEGMTQLRAVCRLMAIANPLLKRGGELRRVYVHGQGCEIRARATGRANDDQDDEQDVNQVIDRHVRNRRNQKTVYGQQAAGEAESALFSDGEIFIAHYTRPKTGWVSLRTFAADEITEVITDPDDRSTAWFYRRKWQRQVYDKQGNLRYEDQELLYPDIDYRPRPGARSGTFAGVKVEWAAPVMHIAVNRPLNWIRGIPDAYAAINWVRAYKEFLEQWATLMRSLAKFAWKLTAEGRNREQAKKAIAQAGTSRAVTGEANAAGGTALLPMNASLEAIPKTGATIDSGSGRPLAMMAAAGIGVPVTMLLMDPGQTGARATAETLDWPTELTMGDRRQLWEAAKLRTCAYVIAEAVRAPSGPLQGTIEWDDATGEEVVTLAGETDDTVDVVWPDLDDVEIKEIIDGIVSANGTGVIPPELVLRHLLTALGVRDVDSIVADMEDDDGNFLWPQTAATAAAAQQAAAMGGDPALAAGALGPDGQPVGVADADGNIISPPGPGSAGGVVVPGQVGTAIVPADGPLAMQNDVDFGLFGGTDTPATPGAGVAGPGEQPDMAFDVDFYQLGAGERDSTEAPVMTDDQPAPPKPPARTGPAPRRRPAKTVTREAAAVLAEASARQNDLDIGLGGSTTPAQRAAADTAAVTAPAGPQPASEFDASFFQL